MDLVYRADHGEGSLRILVEFTAEQRFKAADGVLKRYIAPFQTGKLLGNRERLRCLHKDRPSVTLIFLFQR